MKRVAMVSIMIMAVVGLTGCPANFTYVDNGQLTEELSITLNFGENKYVSFKETFPGATSESDIEWICVEFVDNDGNCINGDWVEFIGFPFQHTFREQWWNLKNYPNLLVKLRYRHVNGEFYPVRMASFVPTLNNASQLETVNNCWTLNLPLIDNGGNLLGSVDSYLAYRMASQGDILCVNQLAYGMSMFDISVPNQPVLIGNYQQTDVVNPGSNYHYDIIDVAINGNIAYLASQLDIKAVDISDPADIRLVDQWLLATTDKKLYVVGSYLIVSSTGNQVFDISDPGRLEYVGRIEIDDYIQSLTTNGDIWYLGCYEKILVVDTSSFPTVTILGEYLLPGHSFWSVDNIGTTVVAACGVDDVKIFECINPENPNLISEFQNGDQSGVWELQIQGTNAYLAYGDYGLVAIDLSDPYNPVKSGFFYDKNRTYDVEIIGENVYLSDGQKIKVVSVQN